MAGINNGGKKKKTLALAVCFHQQAEGRLPL